LVKKRVLTKTQVFHKEKNGEKKEGAKKFTVEKRGPCSEGEPKGERGFCGSRVS